MKQIPNIQVNVTELPKIQGKYKITKRDAKTGKIKSVRFYKNLIPTIARGLIASNFTNPAASSMLITKFCLGTDNTPPANGDTTLGSQVYENAIASLASSQNVFYATGFVDAVESTGHYYEAGLKTADDILISHVAIDEDKDNTETLTIDFEGEIL